MRTGNGSRYSHKLRGTPLEKVVREANFFGKTAHAKFVTCGQGFTEQWDYVCSECGPELTKTTTKAE